ncbi:hypothetical protein G7Z17_g1661 [Cylindrodendrum hubeiense]|uniref:carboxypeptidase C n=1 Tax=Cylindrodendrum hubeiense TaxID=595255 RepID=A0A9P5LCD0_9HYPO|nr:hypothetical protein G7Z17_g1661 [Cylindrodendrum hubeiense]
MVRLWQCLIAGAAAVSANGTFRLQDVPKTICASTGSDKVGYFDFDNNSKHLFFWLAESRDNPSTDPVILWMNGGPGASSVAFGLFGELGPCLIDGPNATKPNPFAWNNHANLIFVDQPVNVGFSYSDDPVKNLEDAMTDMYAFLTSFMENFPKYAHQDFYIMELQTKKDVCNNVLNYCRDKSVSFIQAEHLSPYDFRQTCEDGGLCYQSVEWTEEYLNSSSTREQLGISDDIKFNIVDAELLQNFLDSGDMDADSIAWAEELLNQDYRILVYVGNKDWYCNAAGEKNLVHNLRWKHQSAFQARDSQPFTMDMQEIGIFKQVEGLSFVEIYDAGHMVPADKPQEALFLVESWIQDRLRST